MACSGAGRTMGCADFLFLRPRIHIRDDKDEQHGSHRRRPPSVAWISAAATYRWLQFRAARRWLRERRVTLRISSRVTATFVDSGGFSRDCRELADLLLGPRDRFALFVLAVVDEDGYVKARDLRGRTDDVANGAIQLVVAHFLELAVLPRRRSGLWCPRARRSLPRFRRQGLAGAGGFPSSVRVSLRIAGFFGSYTSSVVSTLRLSILAVTVTAEWPAPTTRSSMRWILAASSPSSSLAPARAPESSSWVERTVPIFVDDDDAVGTETVDTRSNEVDDAADLVVCELAARVQPERYRGSWWLVGVAKHRAFSHGDMNTSSRYGGERTDRTRKLTCECAGGSLTCSTKLEVPKD